MKPAEFFSFVHAGPLLPLYCFWGSERYLQEKALQTLLARWGENPSRGLNYEVFSGASTPPLAVLEALRTLPFLGKQKFVVVRDAEKFAPSSGAHFLAYFEHPLPRSVLVLLGASFGFDKKALQVFTRSGAVMECKSPHTNEVADWARHMAKEKGKTLSTAAASLLQEVVGTNLQELANEVEKLAIYVAPRTEITEEDVAALSSGAPTASVFVLIDQVVSRNVAEAGIALAHLLEHGEHPIVIVTMLARQFRLLRRARHLLERGLPAETVKRQLSIRTDFVWNKLTAQLRKSSRDAIEKSFPLLAEADLILKSRSLPPRLILERVVTDLCA